MKKAPIGRTAATLLSILLPIINLSLITLLISYLIERERAPLYAMHYYSGMLEYIIASLTLTIGGALLAEFAEYDLMNNQ